MIVALEEARLALVNMREDLCELGEQLKIEQAKATVEELEQQTSDPAFWNNQEKSSKVLQTIKQQKDKIESYEALCVLAKDHGISLYKKQFKAMVGTGDIGGKKVMLLFPQTFMNNSGEAVREAMAFYKLSTDQLLVLSDDIALPGATSFSQQRRQSV